MNKIILLITMALLLAVACNKEDKKVNPTPDVAQFSSGGGHTMLLKTDGTLYGTE